MNSKVGEQCRNECRKCVCVCACVCICVRLCKDRGSVCVCTKREKENQKTYFKRVSNRGEHGLMKKEAETEIEDFSRDK